MNVQFKILVNTNFMRIRLVLLMMYCEECFMNPTIFITVPFSVFRQ